MSPYQKVRRWPRFIAYLPVYCTPLGPQGAPLRKLAGKTQCVTQGGLAVLLPETLEPGTPVLIEVCEEEPRRGHVVWIDRRMPTLLGTRVPHGVAFEQPVDPALVHEWVSQAERQSQPRVPIRFEVKIESVQTGREDNGTCLNFSRTGMFIATAKLPAPGTEVLLHFTLPGLSEDLSVPARVVWTHGEGSGPNATCGLGVQFLGDKPLEAALLGTVIDRLCEEGPWSADSSPFFTPLN